jgi:hypothetical protein
MRKIRKCIEHCGFTSSVCSRDTGFKSRLGLLIPSRKMYQDSTLKEAITASLHISVQVIEKIIIYSRAVKLAARGPHVSHQTVFYFFWFARISFLSPKHVLSLSSSLNKIVNVYSVLLTGAFSRGIMNAIIKTTMNSSYVINRH